MSRLLAAVMCLVPLAAAAAPLGEHWGIANLMQALAAVKHLEADFREEKALGVLDRTLVSTGGMRYDAPAALTIALDAPHAETLRFDAERLTIDDPDEGRQTIALATFPPLEVFARSLLATFAGDLATLERYYRVSFAGAPNDWRLTLEPRDGDIARHVVAITIDGRANYVRRIEKIEQGGDRTLTTFDLRSVE